MSKSYATGLSNTPTTDVRWTPPPPPQILSLQPKSINFGPVQAGFPVTANMVLYSSGASSLHVLGYAISGAPDYTMTVAPVTGDAVAPGTNRTYTVKFSPITSGPRNATFTIFTDGADSGTQSCTLTGIGIAPAVSYGATDLFHKVKQKLGTASASQYIPITSTGTGALTVNSVYFIGLNPDSYIITHFPANPLGAGLTDSIGIAFSPKFEGRPDAAVVISTNAYNKPYDTVTLWGVGILPHLVLTVASGNGSAVGSNVTLNFDSVAIGDSVCMSVALDNPGSDTLRIIKQLVTSSDYDFSFFPLKGADTMIVPGQEKLMNICFRPLKQGTRVGGFRFFTNIRRTFESPSRDTSQFNVNVVGFGVSVGRLAFRGAQTDTTLIGVQSCVSDSLVNTGTSSVVVQSVKLGSGQDSAMFGLTVPGLPKTLAPGQSIPLTWCFTPTDRGARSLELQVRGIGADRALVDSFQLLGFGLHQCLTPIPVTLYDTVLLGAKDSKTITVQNCGDIATTDTASFSLNTSGSFALGSAAIAGPIMPAGNASYVVMFSPTSLGASTGTLNIAPVAGTSVALEGWGIGVITSGQNAPITVARGDCENDTILFPNNGNIDWTPGQPLVTGADSADFTLVSVSPGPVAPGGMVQVVLKFCPSSTSAEQATIDFPQSAPAPYTGTPYTFSANGAVNGVAEKYAQDGFVLGQSFPNPTTSTAEVLVQLPSEAMLRLDLVDATGSAVRAAFSGRLSSGSHLLAIDSKDLASGIYYYVLTSGDVRLARQMVVIK